MTIAGYRLVDVVFDDRQDLTPARWSFRDGEDWFVAQDGPRHALIAQIDDEQLTDEDRATLRAWERP